MKVGVRRAAALLTAAIIFVSSGCTGGPSNETFQPVTVLTGFGTLGQDAWLDVAIERGYFKSVGLEVTVRPGKGTANNLTVLTGHQADFAIVDMTGAIIAASQHPDYNFRALAAIYQRSVSTITTLPGTGITSPKDLAGRTIAYQPGGVNHTLFPAYAAKAGLDATAIASIQWRQVAPDQIRQALATRTVDAITETVVGKPGVRAATGRDPVVLPYSDYLSDLYGNVLVAPADSDRDLVRRFRTAATRGLADAMDNPDSAGRIFAIRHPGYPAQVATEEIKLMNSYVRVNGEIGQIELNRVMRSISLLQSLGNVKDGLWPEQLVRQPPFGIMVGVRG
ncbi:hypothetical protein GCM10027290_67390 [Micromonospora sonneratiae]|uniref:Thiamine pyrimidine synthase n=1 Tax=Micromonospora sonneratiae TaxID=1184706 RepID=A0ABW3YM46_9ACTN